MVHTIRKDEEEGTNKEISTNNLLIIYFKEHTIRKDEKEGTKQGDLYKHFVFFIH